MDFGRRLDAVICISEAVRRTLLEGAGPFDNLVVVPNGLDPAAMHATRSRAAVRAHYGLDDAVPVVCMMGNIRKWKGQDTVIRAVHEARDAFPDLRLLLVGETSAADGDYEQQLKALVADLGLGERVVFAGYQSNVADFLEACDVVVHASVLPEPFGRVVLDAMACRKPVVAAHGGAIPEIVVEGETGLTFPPGDASALAAQLARVLGDRGLAERMGQLGYERLMQHFHIDRNVEATERLYRRLLGAAV